MNRKIIKHDIMEGGIFPTEAILKGKVYKQAGKLATVEDGLLDYFMERLPNTECKMEIMDMDFNVSMVDAAAFEFFVRHPSSGDWWKQAEGLSPLNIDLYRDEDSGYMF